MKAHVGDRLVLEGVHVGDPRRVGVIVEIRHPDRTPPYVVRWLDTGKEGLVFPGSESRIEEPTPQLHGPVPTPLAAPATGGSGRPP